MFTVFAKIDKILNSFFTNFTSFVPENLLRVWSQTGNCATRWSLLWKVVCNKSLMTCLYLFTLEWFFWRHSRQVVPLKSHYYKENHPPAISTAVMNYIPYAPKYCINLWNVVTLKEIKVAAISVFKATRGVLKL